MIEFVFIWACVGIITYWFSWFVGLYLERSGKPKWASMVRWIKREHNKKENQGVVFFIKQIGVYVVLWPIMLIVLIIILTIPAAAQPLWDWIFEEAEEEEKRK